MNQIDESNKDEILTSNYDCENCGENVIVKSAIKNREVEEFKRYSELGLECPHCEDWIHISFSSPRLDVLRQKIKSMSEEITSLSSRPFPSRQMIQKTSSAYRRARKNFSVEHKRVNKTMRKKLKRVSPSKLAKKREKQEPIA